MSNVQRSHYVSKFLLRNWEHPDDGTVSYFDFATGRIGKAYARGIYVADAPFPDDVESWLGRTIESPLGDYLARCKQWLGDGDPSSEFPQALPREAKAITLAVLLQAGRTALAQDAEDLLLTEFVRRGDQFHDQIVMASERTARCRVSLVPREVLCFPSSGIGALPLIGGVGMFLPLGPTLLATLVPIGVLDETFRDTLVTTGLLTAFSVGLIGDRAVIPPRQVGADDELTAQALRDYREAARGITDAMLRANATIGVTLGNAWRPE